MGNTHTTLSAKNFDPSRMPVAVSADGKTLLAENAVIFNVGVREIGAFPANAVVALTLSVPGYRDQVYHTATAGLVTQSMLQKGFTFALDKACMETSSLHVRVMSGAQCVAERAIPVKSLKYSGQKLFNDPIPLRIHAVVRAGARIARGGNPIAVTVSRVIRTGADIAAIGHAVSVTVHVVVRAGAGITTVRYPIPIGVEGVVGAGHPGPIAAADRRDDPVR